MIDLRLHSGHALDVDLDLVFQSSDLVLASLDRVAEASNLRLNWRTRFLLASTNHHRARRDSIEREVMGQLRQRGNAWWLRYYRDGRRFEQSAGKRSYGEARDLLKVREGDVAKGAPISQRSAGSPTRTRPTICSPTTKSTAVAHATT